MMHNMRIGINDITFFENYVFYIINLDNHK